MDIQLTPMIAVGVVLVLLGTIAMAGAKLRLFGGRVVPWQAFVIAAVLDLTGVGMIVVELIAQNR